MKEQAVKIENIRQEDFLWQSTAWTTTTACFVLPDRWFLRILQSARSCLSLHGTPLLKWPKSTRPSGQPVGLNVQIAPDVLRLRRFRISGTSTFKKSASCLGRLGSNSSPSATRIDRMDRADDFDVTNSGFFVNSSVGLCRSVMFLKALSSTGLLTPG